MSTTIKSIRLTNYRSCKKTNFPLNTNLSTLIGVNGSGKSNILNGILLLKKITRTNRFQREDETVQSSCKLRVTFTVDDKDIDFEALIKYTTNERNIDEVTRSIQKWNFKNLIDKNQWVKVPITAFRELRELANIMEAPPLGLGGSYSSKTLASFLLATSNISFEKSEFLLQKEILNRILPVIEKIWGYITNISYYSASQFTDPSRCPNFLEIENNRISRRASRAGGEHVKFMYDLYITQRNNPKKFEEYLSIIGSEGIGLVDAIEYLDIKVPSEVIQVATGGNIIRKEISKLVVIPNFIIRENKLSPNQLSEGTFKTLALIFYLITDTSRLLLLEEPEVCIHHGLLSSVLELIKEFSSKRQIIVSTHSDFVLDRVQPENVYIVKNDSEKGTIVKHIPSSMSARDYRALKEYLKKSGNLGEYWRHGELEQ